MYGNGWAWSTAKGVRIGKIRWWKTSVRCARSRSPSVSKSTIANPCAASAGRTCPAKMALSRATSSVVRSAMALNCSAGPIPSGERSRSPAATWSSSPATRTWKNSSSPSEKIARNLIRSNSGSRSSDARSRRRSPKSSHDSSRLMKRSAEGCHAAASSGTFGSSPGTSVALEASPPRESSSCQADETRPGTAVVRSAGPIARSWYRRDLGLDPASRRGRGDLREPGHP